jgi:hypothetical protein
LARQDFPSRAGIVGAGDTGKEDIGATDDDGGVVQIGAVAEGREVGDLVESKKKPRRGAVRHAEVVVKGRRGADGGEEGVAGEGGADERRERG